MKKDGEIIKVDNPADLPDPSAIEEIREPIIEATILVPQDYLGPVINLCIEKRGVQKNLQYLGGQVQLVYELPLNEVVLDFFDRLKSVSRGYASFEYDFRRFQACAPGEAGYPDQRRAGGCAVDSSCIGICRRPAGASSPRR